MTSCVPFAVPYLHHSVWAQVSPLGESLARSGRSIQQMLLQNAAAAGGREGLPRLTSDSGHSSSRHHPGSGVGRNTAAMRAALGHNKEALLTWFYEQVQTKISRISGHMPN